MQFRKNPVYLLALTVVFVAVGAATGMPALAYVGAVFFVIYLVILLSSRR